MELEVHLPLRGDQIQLTLCTVNCPLPVECEGNSFKVIYKLIDFEE